MLKGIATNDVAIDSVNFSLNGSPFTPADTSAIINGVSWSADLMLSPGTNKFAAYAVGTNGNTSATNNIIIIRGPSIITFLIATNEAITHPWARIAFDGTNYLVVFQSHTNQSGLTVGQFVSPAGTNIGPLLTMSTTLNGNDPPCVDFDGSNYLVAWAGDSGGSPAAMGAFISPDGVVQPPLTLSESTTVDNFGTIAFGGGVYFLMWSDKSTSPDSIYGTIVSPSGDTSGDFLISANGNENIAAQSAAAFDGTNFLAVWYSANGNLSIKGQLIDPSGNLVGNPIQIYTSATAAATAVPSVTFDGTKFLVLFNIGISSASSSAYHVIGRLVTTDGTVLTNQVALTADSGPQIVGSSDFDGFNFLMAWNQGLNPFAFNASATINARFFDPVGMPVSTEFPVFKTQGSLVPLWSSVLFDGTKFVMVGGLGKQIGGGAGDLTFTNGVIYGAFITP
jgi:hypothetical protein